MELTVSIDKSGRVLIPAEVRSAFGLEGGDTLVLSTTASEIRLFTRAQAVARAQEIVRRHVPAGASLVDELLRERSEDEAGG